VDTKNGTGTIMAFPPYGSIVPTLNNYQMYFANTEDLPLGILMGEGTPYQFYNITGMSDNPVVRNGDVARPRDTGEFLGLDVYGGRDIVIGGDVTTNGISLQNALVQLAASINTGGVTENPLWIQLPGLPVLCSMVRARKRDIPVNIEWAGGLATSTIAFHATDPRLYGAPVQMFANIASPGGGLTFPVTFPVTFGGNGYDSLIDCDNTGNFNTLPTLEIHGPITNPTVANYDAGWSLSFANPSSGGFTLNTGDVLVIDTDLHTVSYTASGTTTAVPRPNWVVPGSVWPSYQLGIDGLQPGNNTIAFSSTDSGSVAGYLYVNFAPAFIL
jgi:hypothetical protein